MRVLLTGGAGFIGHHVVDHVLRVTDWEITLIDRLDTSGNLNRLAEIGAVRNKRVRYFYHDLRAPFSSCLRNQLGAFDYILHLAAGTHVDRSIAAPLEFVYDNVVATCNMLDFARATGCKRFLYFSTDEVFGPAPAGVSYREDDRYRSGNPYAATKAGAEELAVAYHNTYALPVFITHTMNVIGRRQHPEKFVPNSIRKILSGETITIHADQTRTKPGSRCYIAAEDVASAVLFLFRNGACGEKYNIVGSLEINNLDMAQRLARALGRNMHYELVDFHSSRPGHDLRYALDGSKLAHMGWSPKQIDAQIRDIAIWTAENARWL